MKDSVKYVFVVIKRGKYLKSHSYATGLGTRYYWTKDISEAKHFDQLHSDADHYADATGGKIIKTPTNE